MKTGIEMIATEREEQIKKHGFSIYHDHINNDHHDLLCGVIALINNDFEAFSDNWSREICQKMISKPALEKLAIAGAFIAAEIDRLIYLEQNLFVDQELLTLKKQHKEAIEALKQVDIHFSRQQVNASGHIVLSQVKSVLKNEHYQNS